MIDTLFNIILLILFVFSFVFGIYLLLNWKMLVKSNKEKEQEFYKYVDLVYEMDEEDLDKILQEKRK